ncbi:MAG: HEPN domain-containing protein [Burkholderiales bacterium]|nr:HEPN domain-containing protein [Burkholderiales bacterium]
MTTDELASAYFDKARKRWKVPDALAEQEAWSDVAREAEELVELAPRGTLRWVGVDTPRRHDVGPILVENSRFFAEAFRDRLPRLAEISLELRKERERAFYGDVDVVPTRHYGPEHAQRAIEQARCVLESLDLFEPLHRPDRKS